LADIIYVVNGMLARIGSNGDMVFDSIIKSKSKSVSIPNNSTNFQKIVLLLGSFISTDRILTQIPPLAIDVQTSINVQLQKLENFVQAKHYENTINSLGLILFGCYEMSYDLQADMDKIFDMVHSNNMSKLCDTEEEAQRSVVHLNTVRGDNGILMYDSPDYRLAPDQRHWVLFNRSTKKILKSIKYVPVDLRKLYQQQS